MGFGWAKVGAKVVCIKKGRWASAEDGETPPKYGEIYTIRDVAHSGTETYLRFQEIINPKFHYADGYVEAAWYVGAFRPLITLEDDISMFTALTNMSPIERLDRLKEMMDQ